MKVLFISEFLVYGEECGAKAITKQHYKVLKQVAGEENVHCISPVWKKEWMELNKDKNTICLCGCKNKIQKIKNILSGNVYLVSNKMIDDIMKIVEKNKYDVIFFGNTLYGKLVKRIKETYPNIKLLQFLHGVNVNSRIIEIKDNYKKIIKLPQLLSVYYNEHLSIKYSDENIILNERDNNILKKFYNIKTDKFLPIFFESENINLDKTLQLDGKLNLLFVGGYFWPNINGIKWFAKNVMPYIKKDIKLYIVGNKMELLKNEEYIKNKENIIVVGRAEDLSEWYNSVDIVVGPIFDGDGMKTKTAEAMMYGKIFLGTSEAFCGYKYDDKYRCESDVDFIDKINSYYNNKPDKYNEDIRNNFIKYYSDIAAKEIIKRLLLE